MRDYLAWLRQPVNATFARWEWLLLWTVILIGFFRAVVSF